jgi:shikimate kinase
MSQTQIKNLKSKLSKPIVLIGMMGAGKSHIGSALAQSLDLGFFDSDREIETKAGQSVADIFKNFGEKKFRDAERNTILELMERGPCIIATGGGAVMDDKTRESLLENAIVIWLDAPVETLWERVQKSKTRPLLHTDNPKQRLSDLLVQRKPLYAQAHIRIAVSARTAQEEVIKALYDFLNKDSV